ncbi:MAG: hypothetical protein NTX45_02585 [Proteobacteria bacterium]|nr:hypothetical protein [Pseudomonadota bacterium]
MTDEITRVNPEWIAQTETRKERADYYFQKTLQGQGEWYDKMAGINKTKHQYFAFLVIILGTLVSFMQVLPEGVRKHEAGIPSVCQ